MDVNQIAKKITKEATKGKNPAAVELGRLGVEKGGPARAKKLTAARRSDIAKNAALRRWNKKG